MPVLNCTLFMSMSMCRGAMKTFEYYKTVHNRNGIRDDAVGAQSRVHYGNSYNNAYCECVQ